MGKGEVQNIENTNASLVTEVNDEIDVLDRKSFIEQIIKVIEHYADKKQSASFSIQGSWGSGKSWIINNIVTELYNMQDIDISGGKYCVLKFNPWEYDYYNEPLLSLILSLKNQVNSEKAVFPINKEHIQMFKDSMEILSNELVEPVFDFISIVSGNPAVSFLRKFFINKTKKIKYDLDKKSEDNKKQKRYINPYIDLEELMRITVKGLNEISKNKTVIVLIDELDRCLPEYAIKVLERMHHITQNVQNFQIIYSIDKGQIEETVHKIYGSKIDSKEYLKKFISFGFNLSVGNLNHNFIKRNKKLFNGFDFIFTDNFDIEIAFSSILPEITMRERENIIEKITLINNMLNTKNEVQDISILYVELLLAFCTYFDIDIYQISPFCSNENDSIIISPFINNSELLYSFLKKLGLCHSVNHKMHGYDGFYVATIENVICNLLKNLGEQKVQTYSIAWEQEFYNESFKFLNNFIQLYNDVEL